MGKPNPFHHDKSDENYRQFHAEMSGYGWSDFEIDETWAEMDESSRRDDRKCPYPIGDDDGTARQCIGRGHCGCDEAPNTPKAREWRNP